MKFLGLVLLALISQSSFAQGLMFGAIPEIPRVLELEKRTIGDESKLRHVDLVRGAEVNTRFVFELLSLQQKLLDKGEHVSCEGSSEFGYDDHGVQYILVKSIDVCLNEDGEVVARAVGRSPLTNEEVQLISKRIVLTQKLENVRINDGSRTYGVSSKVVEEDQESNSTTNQD